MCIAIYKPTGTEISADRLERCWNHHPHGGGLAVPDGDGGVLVRKAMTWAEFATHWDDLSDPAAPMLVHFRWATHGAVNVDNCHPHRIADDLVMIHNGVIHPMADHASEQDSDTVAFVDRVLRQMPIEAITSAGVTALLDNYIGRSRLAFLNGRGDVSIVGETRGVWADDGCWYSNDTYHRTPIRQRATRTLPTAPYPLRREDPRDNEAERRAAAHDLLSRYGPDLALWNDEDLAILAAAYEDWPDDDGWEDVA